MLTGSLNCSGCAVCAAVCPKQLIRMGLSAEGFYRPYLVRSDLCTGCSRCQKVCAAVADPESSAGRPIQAYSIVAEDRRTLMTCSSGGAAFEIAATLMEHGYRACGVRYNSTSHVAEHFVASTPQEYEPSKGSKYLQSEAHAGFRAVLGPGRWAVFGTPCQIASFRRSTTLSRRRADYVLIDFFCHGVPTYWLWRQYLAHTSTAHRLGPVTKVSFRDKRNGWGQYTMVVSDGDKEVTGTGRGRDLFLSFFLSDLCLNASCYRCRYRLATSEADIRVGDLWDDRYAQNRDGISGVLALTERGVQVVRDLNGRCAVRAEPLAVVTGGQMISSPSEPRFRKRLLRQLADGRALKQLYWTHLVPHKARLKLARIISKMKAGRI